MSQNIPKIEFKPNLLFCILMDAIGCASYLMPALGEFADVIWAPLSAYIFYKTFGGVKGVIGGAINFIEEILPGLDFLPTYTIAYFINKNK